MAKKRTQKPLFSRSLKRALTALTKTAIGAGAKVVAPRKPASVPRARKRLPAKRPPAPTGDWSTGVAIGAAGMRCYRLYQPPGVRRAERLPLLVMLHGCGQNAEGLAASSQMNRVAARERFLVLYPEQDRLSNAAGCWNWYDTRSGRAQREADIIEAAIEQVCRQQPVHRERIALAGISAGAGMAALLATRCPERFRAIAMHSGIAPGVAHSSATAFMAMCGRKVVGLPVPSAPLVPLAGEMNLPALLVIHGSRDPVVAPSNGADAARLWAARVGAKACAPRSVQRGARYAATITDYRCRGLVVATLCAVDGLGHAWSGGAAGQAFSDPQGPDASRMIWAFMAKQFARGADWVPRRTP